MRIGFALGNIGPIGTPENLVRIARHAEDLGYDSLWTIERLLWPLQPQTPYPVTRDGMLPHEYKHVLDPLDAITFVAGHTTKIALGTSVLDMPYYNPVLLARRLTSIDVLSSGRLRVGLGLGWSKDEFDAAGAELSERGARADEFLDVLKAIWTSDPVEFHGKYYRVPKSVIGPKPVQKPHPPIYLAAFAPAALQRVARAASGWNPVGIPLSGVKQMFEQISQFARDAGRDASKLELIVRGNLEVTGTPVQNGRSDFQGTPEQVREDIDRCRALGADELILDPTFSAGAQDLGNWLRLMDQFGRTRSATAPTR
jgi:probable F420-dependent oxidoreductase